MANKCVLCILRSSCSTGASDPVGRHVPRMSLGCHKAQIPTAKRKAVDLGLAAYRPNAYRVLSSAPM